MYCACCGTNLVAYTKTEVMKQREEKEQLDNHLDIPSEANRDKHINFLDAEDNSDDRSSGSRDSFAEERKKQWQDGLAEGEKLRREGGQ